MTKINTINPDGTLELTTTDTRTPEQKLKGKLTFAEKLELAYPTQNVDTSHWESYDDHKLFK